MSGEAARKIKFLLPQSPHGFSALARLYYLATKTDMLRRLQRKNPDSSFLSSYIKAHHLSFQSDAYVWTVCTITFESGFRE